MDFRLLAAPLQGYTEAPFRHFHSRIYGPGTTYYMPFIRMEKGKPRGRDVRDMLSPLNVGVDSVPQIIAADSEEFTAIAQAISLAGYSRADLNMGCPFAPQVRKGRGAGLLASPDRVAGIIGAMRDFPGMRFSVKMRLGVDSPEEWRRIAPLLAEAPLECVAVHPRTASQQYSGALHVEEFEQVLDALPQPVVFNGDVVEPRQIAALRDRFPGVAGVMAGRGLLMRPSLFAEWLSGEEWPQDKRRQHILELHDSILSHYRDVLCGPAQILSKIKPLWEYLAADFPRREVKRIVKARTMEAYDDALNVLRASRG